MAAVFDCIDRGKGAVIYQTKLLNRSMFARSHALAWESNC